ncbi:streptamidine family RiPP [Streptomyces sp. NPDC055051]
MSNEQIFAPIADPGQLAHASATHSNALVENPFEDGAEGTVEGAEK